jgi:hypothetical protein
MLKINKKPSRKLYLFVLPFDTGNSRMVELIVHIARLPGQNG